jgi:hypothetical protein
VLNITLSIPATEQEKHPETLAAGQISTFHFTVEFPLATDESSIQLVLTSIKSSTQAISKPINVITLSSSNIIFKLGRQDLQK